MKKSLIGSSALASAALLAAAGAAQASDTHDGKIKLSVGGAYEAFVTYVDQDPVRTQEFHEVNVRHEGEIHFEGSTVLDNGLLQVGFVAQLEAITQGDQVDQTFVFLEGTERGDWGRAEIGSRSAAAYLMSYAAPFAGLGVNSPNFFLFSPNTAFNTTSGYLNATNDANKITYFTPRFGGFQLGVSYTPNIDNVDGDRQSFGLNTDDDLPVDGLNPFVASDAWSDFVSLGANFVQSFEGFDVAVSGGYEFGSLESDAPGFDDYEAWGGGAQLGFAGFVVGGSYIERNRGLDDSDHTWWDAGVTYSWESWTFGITYANSATDLPGGGEDTRDLGEVGVTYSLSPGVSVVGAAQYFEEDNDSEPDVDREGWAIAVGTRLSF